MRSETEIPARFSPLFALSLVLSLALLEPALGRLEKLGDALESEQYLLICPTAELAYLFPALRSVPVLLLTSLAAPLLVAGLVPAFARLRRGGADPVSAAGLALVGTGLSLIAAEYAVRGQWVLARMIGARYLAMAMVAVGAFLGCRDRRYLAALGVGGFTWDLSSAVFWAVLNRSLAARVPVPWRHHFDSEEARGAPCWLVCVTDTCAIAFFSWLSRSETDPVGLFAAPERAFK